MIGKYVLWMLGGTAGLALFAWVLGSLLLLGESLPEAHAWFQPGDQFYSRREGFRQIVIAANREELRIRLELDPHAAGPPEHQHLSFDEAFYVTEGQLSLLINGEKKLLRAGEHITIPRGVPHKPFNESGSPVVVGGENGGLRMPVRLGWCLSQLYPLMDAHGPMSGRVLQQVSVWGSGFDSWPSGPPLAAQRLIRVLVAPFARLSGIRKTPFPKT